MARSSTRSATLPYFLLVTLTMMSMGGIFALLGQIRDELGFSETQLGATVAVGFFTAFGAQVSLARWSDRGHSALMIRIGLVGLVSALVLMAVARTFILFGAARMLLGLGVGCLLPAVRRVVILSEPDRVGANIGKLGSFDVAGFITGPLISGVLADWLGYQASFWVFAALSALFVPVVLRLPADTGARSTERRVLSVLWSLPAIRAVMVAAVGWFAMIGVFEAVWAVMLTDRGASNTFIGITMSIALCPMLFLAPFVGGFAQRRGPLRVVMVGVLFVAPCFVAYGHVETLWIIAAISFVQGLGDAFVFPSTQVGVAVAAPPSLAASAQGIQGATLELTAGTMALVAGFLYDVYGPEVVYTTVGVVMALGVAAAFVLSRRLPSDHPVLRPGALQVEVVPVAEPIGSAS